MKWQFLALMLFCFLANPLFAAAIDIRAEVETRELNETTPIKGLITVSHPKNVPIDPASFKMEKAPLSVSLIKEEPMTATGDLVLSIFSFTLPPKPKGAYSLPSISANVAGKEYRSIPTTYQVNQTNSPSQATIPNSTPKATPNAANPADPSQTKAPEALKSFLKLEPFIDGPSTLYPGQQTTLGYRYLFNVNLDTQEEKVPLLEAKGLKKIGDKVVKEGENEGISILEISQVVEGDKPGNYSFGPSSIEGIPYVMNASGEKSYGEQKLLSEAPPVLIEVIPFPENDVPASFNGSLGNYTWQVSLKSPGTVKVGDEITLEVNASGKGNLKSLQLPKLCCQPGMSGFFQLSDLPPSAKIDGDVKQFTVAMRPLTDAIKEIPSLEFSSFDPDSKTYTISHSDPIPLTVTAAPSPIQAPSNTSATTNQPANWPQDWNRSRPIEIIGNYPLSTSDLSSLWFGTWWSLLILPFGFGAMIFQNNLKKELLKKQALQEQENAADLFVEAEKAPLSSSEQCHLLKKAFLARLVEISEISHGDVALEDLSNEGIQGKIKVFLLDIEKLRFTGKVGYPGIEELKKARTLFDSMKK